MEGADRDERFIQIHYLTSYPASLINRDDVGFAKRIPFGSATRIRISSQCLKRHWRTSESQFSLKNLAERYGQELSVRSRRSFEEYVYKPLVEQDGIPENTAREITAQIMKEVLGTSAKTQASKKEATDESSLESNQLTVLGRRELNYLRELARTKAQQTASAPSSGSGKKGNSSDILTKEEKENLRALKSGAGLDAAMFGRMVTSDYLARVDAAIHVAHAFTVHRELAESDFFTAVDDLLSNEESEELGSAHINTMELTSGLFYGYVVVDWQLLLDNLQGVQNAKQLAQDAVNYLVNLIATESPGAKRGATAPYAYAHMMLVERGKAQPRTLANAFLNPISERRDLIANTYQALATHLSELDRIYGKNHRRFIACGPVEKLTPPLEKAEMAPSLADLANFAAGKEQ